MAWNPAHYLRFGAERSRPFFDLIAQVRSAKPKLVVDLGCGPGHLTAALADRWPEARIIGVDSSEAMLVQARSHTIPGRLDFVHADLAQWMPSSPIDVVVSNAALQWVGNHPALLLHLTRMLADGGELAVQMPRQHDMPARVAIAKACADPRWADRLAGAGLQCDSVQPLRWYVERLMQLGLTVNAWETTFFHVLHGDDPILAWYEGTALPPLLERLDVEEAIAFRERVGLLLRQAYPAAGDMTTFPFPRLFFVARKAGGATS